MNDDIDKKELDSKPEVKKTNEKVLVNNNDLDYKSKANELSGEADKNVEVKQDSSTITNNVKENDVKNNLDNKSNVSESKNIDKSKNKQKTDDSSLKKQVKQNSNNKNPRNNKNSNQSDESEFIEKLVSINRVAKVVKGGRRFSFAALVVVGDGNGMVGHGKGKAKEVPEAIKKATDEAKANLIRVPLRQARTLHHDITGKYDAGKVHLRSAPSGTGVIAGGPMRAVFEALGIKDIVAKSIGSSNPHNMIRATFVALGMASSPKLISLRRGLKVNEITKRRKGAQTVMEVTQDG